MFSEGYVGISSHYSERMTAHKGMYSGTNQYLKNVIQKYGWENLVSSKVIIGDVDYCLSVEAKLRPKEKLGWNLATGGGKPPVIRGDRPELKGRPAWNKGKKMSAEYKAKLSIIHTERLKDPDLRKRISESVSRSMTPEVRQKMSVAKQGVPSPIKGRKHSEETKRLMSEAKKGQPSPMKGKQHSDETRQKMREAKRNNPLSDEQRRSKGDYARGRKWYNNGTNAILCGPLNIPDGYVAGRGNTRFKGDKTCHP